MTPPNRHNSSFLCGLARETRRVLAAGQCWTFRSHDGATSSRLVIGAILAFESAERIVCVSMFAAEPPTAEQGGSASAIAFLPLSEAAFRATVIDLCGTGEPADGFATEFEIWRADPRGLTVFTVPFDGSLDRLIARQMEAIVNERRSPPE